MGPGVPRRKPLSTKANTLSGSVLHKTTSSGKRVVRPGPPESRSRGRERSNAVTAPTAYPIQAGRCGRWSASRSAPSADHGKQRPNCHRQVVGPPLVHAEPLLRGYPPRPKTRTIRPQSEPKVLRVMRPLKEANRCMKPWSTSLRRGSRARLRFAAQLEAGLAIKPRAPRASVMNGTWVHFQPSALCASDHTRSGDRGGLATQKPASSRNGC